ncbi:MAG: WhiB family transcriptional regulator, partial [Pseudonocardia sp.]|nr:WhiB family transcriptional regulator [Pseudonocardia sp.]
MSDFRLSALCAGADPEIWFPTAVPGTEVYDREVGRAKAICAGCPVRARCLDWALATADDFGMLGGLDPSERRALK